MVFSSIEFLWFFMPVVLALYLALPPRARNALLVGVSLVFYAWGAQALVLLFLGSIAVNYAAGLLIAREQARGELRRARTTLVGAAGLGSIGTPHILLPLGISFFTFHGISYVVDVHRGTSRPMRSVVDYGQYMAFFPQLIAGPIVRYHEIDEQIRSPPPRTDRMADIAAGFPRFALGLTK